MKITEGRNATLRLDFGGVRFLIDPMLAEQGAYPGFEPTASYAEPSAPSRMSTNGADRAARA